MNRSVRRVGLGLALAMLALLGIIDYDQVIASNRFVNNPYNRRLLVKEYSTQRGEILDASGGVLAESVPTADRLKYLRRYPSSTLFAGITGYYSITYGAYGLERTFNDYLVGSEPVRSESFVDELLGRDRKGNTILLTLRSDLQRIAAQKLGNQRGAAVAINTDTGAILAMYSNPSYDPNPLSTHDTKGMESAWSKLVTNPLQPLISRAYGQRYPPGSTFKVITAAAALQAGVKPGDTFANPSRLTLPQTDKTLGNFGGGACRGGGRISFAQGLRVSCNTTFAQIGMKIGTEALVAMAEKFGIDRSPEFDLPATISCIRAEAGAGCRTPTLDKAHLAYTSIGQYEVRVTPLQMAIVTATIANGGRVPRPYLVGQVQDYTGRPVWEHKPELSAPIYSAATAKELRDMMIGVVKTGTGTMVRISGVEIGGKTGTAETGVPKQAPHAWFIMFAPHIAVAVVVENGGNLGNDATGGKVAAPIAKAIVEAFRGSKSSS